MTPVIATVNGRPIRQSDLDNAIQGLAMEQHRKTMDQLDDQERKILREMALEKLVARELIYQEALGRGVVADEEQIEAEKSKIISNFPSEEEFYATMANAGIDATTYHRMLRQDLTVNRLTEEQLAEVPDPTPEEIKATYRNHPEQMKRAARVRACHILIRIPDGQRDEALARIRELRVQAATEDFGQLARLHSACPSATGGGDLGYFRRGDMARSFEEAAFDQPVGEVGEVVETQFGFHLVKVLDREEAEPLTLEEATPKICRLLKDQAGSLRLREWVSRLREKADIVLEP